MPVSHLGPSHLADIIDTLRDAAKVFDGSGGPNGPYSSLNDECQIIDDACDRYAHRPIMLLRICRRVVGRVSIKEANGDCPRDDPLVRDFASSIAGAAGDLMAFDPDVKQAETARAAMDQMQVPPTIARGLLEAANQSAEVSEGELKHELPMNAQAAVHPTPSDDQQLALYETKSRLLRILVLTKDRAKNGLDHIEKNPMVYSSILAILLFLLA